MTADEPIRKEARRTWSGGDRGRDDCRFAGVEPIQDRLDLTDTKLQHQPVVVALVFQPIGLYAQIAEPALAGHALGRQQAGDNHRIILLGKEQLGQELQAEFAAMPNGLTVDTIGRLYLAGPGGIWVLDANGGRLGVIATPETPSACAFGDADGHTLYIAAETSLYKVRLKVTDGR